MVIIGLVIFYRDLRLHDNRALIRANAECDKIYCAFIVDAKTETANNPRKSRFLAESLYELDGELRARGSQLHYIREISLSTFISRIGAKKIYSHRPRAFLGPEDIIERDYYLFPDIRNSQARAYRKFTPFAEAAAKARAPKKSNSRINWSKFARYSREMRASPPHVNVENNYIRGGRTEGLRLLARPVGPRDILVENTTLLSPHNHFGTLSIREVWARYAREPDVRRQLLWRDFYGNMQDIEAVKCSWTTNNTRGLSAWTRAETGIAIVDAIMNQLNTTGWIHNRARLIAATALVWVIGVDWRAGERYFAHSLVDYDPAQNYYNWCWVASASSFANPPFRVLSVERQAKKYDYDNKYVALWSPVK